MLIPVPRHEDVLRSGGIAYLMSIKKCKAIPVTGREGPLGCETSRLPHFLDNMLTDGSEVVSLQSVFT
jgi:hypothetical protein